MKTTLLVALAAAAALVAGCGGQGSKTPQGTGPVIASVDGEKLTKDQLDSLAPEGFAFDQQNLPKVLDKWVSNTLMYREALKRGIEKEPSVQAHLDRLQRDYLVNELLDRLTSSVTVDQAALLDYYAKHKDEFTYEVKIMRIILPDSLMAVQTLAELQAGADFKKLAKERSQDVLLEAGQESKYFSRGVGDPRMGGDPAVEEAIFGLQPGQTTGVIPSQEGYQIIRLVDRKKTKPEVSFTEAKDYIAAILNYRRSQAVVDSVLTALRAQAKIELKPDAYFGAAK
jgi:peptidyl-prolyl cis-trans isomerase C